MYMNKFKSFLALLAAVLMVATAAGCGHHDEKLSELKVGLMPDTCSLPFIIAQEKGYFAEEGLKVDLQQFKSAMDRDSALQSGNLDGAVSDLLAVGFAKDGGFDVKVTSATDGDYRLVAGKAAGTKDPKMIAGKDVAVSKNTIIEYVTDRILEKAGMKPDSINKVAIPQIPARLEMLQSGKLTAATLPEPMDSIAMSNGCVSVTSAKEMGINPGVVMFTEKAVSGKKAEIQAFYRAYNKAVHYLNETPPEEYMDIVIEKGGFPPASRSALVLPKYREAVLPNEEDISACMSWLIEKGLVKSSFGYNDIVSDVIAK